MKTPLMVIRNIEILSKDDKTVIYRFLDGKAHHSLKLSEVKRITYTDGKARIVLKAGV